MEPKSYLERFQINVGSLCEFIKKQDLGTKLESIRHDNNIVFLSCDISNIPFNFLGVSVGVNPRKQKAWESIVKKLWRRLASWKRREMSMGGIIVMLNVVRTNILVYQFSFYKAPKLIVKEIIRIQREVLWGGTTDQKKINWVSWKRICRSKKKGSLGIEHYEIFNLALLSKWLLRAIS